MCNSFFFFSSLNCYFRFSRRFKFPPTVVCCILYMAIIFLLNWQKFSFRWPAYIFVCVRLLGICLLRCYEPKKRARTQNVLQRNYTQNCSQSLKSRVCGTTNEKVTISDSNVVVVVAVYLEIEYPRFCCFIFLFFFVLFLTSKIISECQAPSEYEPIRRTNFNDRFHGSYNFSAKKPWLFLKHIHCMLSLVLNHQ